MADANAQLAAIWNVMSPVVEQQIKASGTFSTFGAGLRPDGVVEAIVPSGSMTQDSAFRAHLQRVAAEGQYTALGMASRVEAQVPESPAPLPGILYQFDNADGVSQATFLPYGTDAAGELTFGQLHGQEGGHDLFPAH